MAYALHQAVLQTPVGNLLVEASETAVMAIRILSGGEGMPNTGAHNSGPIRMALDQIGEYFAGTRQHFDLPLAPLASNRGTALREGMIGVAYGTTTTYGALARALGSAPRAIGQACRRNPLPIIVPCHRITSASGPEYYSAGEGVATKSWLIAHERAMETRA